MVRKEEMGAPAGEGGGALHRVGARGDRPSLWRGNALGPSELFSEQEHRATHCGKQMDLEADAQL